MDGVVVGAGIPVIAFADLIPPILCALECNTCQVCAITESKPPYARDAVRDGDARQARATVERTLPDACDATVCGDDARFVTCNQSFGFGFN